MGAEEGTPAAVEEAWLAPAKINLFLHVTGRRDDGYHLLQTVFQFLDLADRLWFVVTADGQIRCEGNDAQVAPHEDLTLRAARLLQELSGSSAGARIRIRKQIPIGGGLGGGSSNAATTLVALNQLWGAGLTTDELAAAGLQLGADVPVFVRGFAAWGEGVGERLQPVSLPESWYLVVFPKVSVATAAVFGADRLSRTTPEVSWDDFLQGRCRNDCEPVVRQLYPEVGAALDWLNARAAARLSGTGASIFAACADRPAATELLAELPKKWGGFVTRGRNRSPLHAP